MRLGVPQGAVTSPLLFNFYLCHLPRPPENSNILIVQYADDISIFITGGNNIKEMGLALTNYAKEVTSFLEERGLLISPEKSSVTYFSPDTKDHKKEADVKLNGIQVPTDKHPKILGLTLDPMYKFGPHIDKVVSSGKSKLNALKALAGTDWGQEKEMLTTAYKATLRSNIEYAIAIWGPIISGNHWNRIQTLQNHALRIATGCVKMSSIDHLHQETQVLPLKEHSEMLTKQFLTNFQHPEHPGNADILQEQDQNARSKKKTLLEHRETVDALFNRADMPNDINKKIKRCKKHLHTETVKKVLSSYQANRVLEAKPPKIHTNESSLSRKSRVKLAQYRSGFVPDLFSYKHRIDNSIPDSCPSCGQSPHDVKHVFNCPEKPTNLQLIDLWKKPVKIAEFLDLDRPPDD